MSFEFDGRILQEVASLGLPEPENFILYRSGSVAEWGAIPVDTVNDIDGLIEKDSPNWEHLVRKVGWKAIRGTVGYTRDGRPVRVDSLSGANKRFDIFPHDFSPHEHQQTGYGRIQFSEAKAWSVQDPKTRIRVATLEYFERTTVGSERPQDIIRREAIRRHRLKLQETCNS